MITLIAAIDPNNVIGNNGKTPWHIPEELALFKKITVGHAVIVGRKTFDAIGILPDRKMFVLSRSPLLTKEREGVRWCSSIQDALTKTKDERSVFVIGGGEVYAEMMPLADELLISHIHQEYSGDVYFRHFALQATRGKPEELVWKEITRTEYPLFTHIHYIRNEQSSKNR